MGESEDEFIWVSKDELRDATDEELIEEIIELQQHVHTLQNDVDELEELVYLLLDIQAGIGEKFHPELFARLETLGEDDSLTRKAEIESENG